MTSRSLIRLLALLVFVLLIAACGDDDKGPSKSKSDAKTKNAGTKTEKTAETDDAGVIITPGTGIAGVAIDDDRAKVEKVLGTPTNAEDTINQVNSQPQTILTYDDPAVRVFLSVDTVTQVETTDPNARAGAIKVGSTQAQVIAAYPAYRCDAGDVVVCRSGPDVAGEVLTDFLLEGDAVTRVVVGRLVD